MLCSGIRLRAPKMAETMPWLYKLAHAHHPMTKWVASDKEHFRFALQLGEDLASEYKLRYGREHKCVEKLCQLRQLGFPDLQEDQALPSIPKTQYCATGGLPADIAWLPLCMPEKYRHPDASIAYRNYYESKAVTMKKKPTNRRKSPELMGQCSVCKKRKVE